MARASSRNARPPQEKPADKLRAALSYTYGEMVARGTKTSEYLRAPFYFDALWQWYQGLNADRRELVRPPPGNGTSTRYGNFASAAFLLALRSVARMAGVESDCPPSAL
jgi:hypothetical protein